MSTRVPIGQMLLKAGHIDAWQLQAAIGFQKRWGCRLGRALVNLGLIAERTLLNELARQHGVRWVNLTDLHVPPEIVKIVPERVIRKHKIFPVALSTETRRGTLVVATSEPQDLAALDEVAFATGKAVKPALASESEIEKCIERHLGSDRSIPLDGPAWGSRNLA